MGSLFAGVLHGLGLPAGLAADSTPYVPSAPVQIGTSGPRHGVPEVGSWQALIAMFAVVIVVGAAVLMFAVRQRTRVLERRRVRRMAEAVAALAEYESLSELGGNAPVPAVRPTPPRTTARSAPATPSRPAPNA
jgi:hypothetical protein